MKTYARRLIRPATKVVNQPKPEPAWPLERAVLIRKSAENLRAAEANARAQAQRERLAGRAEGRDDFARSVLADGDFRKHFVRAAAEQIGREAGRSIEDWMRHEIDPTLAQRKKVADAVLSCAVIDNRFSELVADEPVMATSVEFPPRRFAFNQVLPRW